MYQIRKLGSFIKIKQFLKFCLIGIINNFLGYIFFFFLLKLGISYILSLTLTYFLSLLFSFFMQSFFTFKSRNNKYVKLFKFYFIYFLMFLLNFMYLYFLKENFNINAEIGQLIIIPQIAFINFILLRYFVFRN